MREGMVRGSEVGLTWVVHICALTETTLSFDIFLAIAEPGVRYAEVRSAFGLSLTRAPSSRDTWPLKDCELLLTKGGTGRVIHISVHRPTATRSLWKGLFQLLQRGDAVFFYPSDPLIPVVTDPRAIKLMPTDMQESFGRPHVVRSVKELIDSLDLDG